MRVINIREDSSEFRIEDIIANECRAVTEANQDFMKGTPVRFYVSWKRDRKSVGSTMRISSNTSSPQIGTTASCL